MIEKEFIPYDLTQGLKKLGFNEDCLGYYNTLEKPVLLFTKDSPQSAIIFSQAFRWFREEYNIDTIIIPKFGDNGYGAECYKKGSLLSVELLGHYTYKEAELTCLKKLIKIVKYEKDK